MLLTLNNLTKQIILSLLVISLILPSTALAFVTTTGMPFAASNLIPGATVAGSIAIENTTGATQKTGLQIFNPTGDFALFASEMTYNVTGDFVATGEMGDLESLLQMSDVADNATGNFGFSLTLNEDAPQDPLMGKGFGFTLCVGFVGSEPVCGVAFVPPTSGGGGGGSGGGSGTIVKLQISNENAAPLGIDTATITWDTNRAATSQVVYGLASSGPYTLNESNLPNLGYPFGTTETNTNVDNHTVDLSGLNAGETYLYRVVSTRNGDTVVSPELSFTLLSGTGLTTPAPQGLVLGETTSGLNNLFGTGGGGDTNPDGIVLGAEDVAGNEDGTSTAAGEDVLGAVLGDAVGDGLVSVFDDETSCILLFIIVLLVIWLIWSLIDDFIINRGNNISRKLLLSNLAFVAGVALILIFLNDFLNWFGSLLLLIATIFFIVMDHMKHGVRLLDWSPKNRHIYFTIAFALAAATAYFVGQSCLILPLLAAAVIQIVWATVEL